MARKLGDTTLSRVINRNYRTNATVGSGSTADAVRNEILTRVPTGGVWHSSKAATEIRGLRNWLRDNSNASAQDIRTAQNLIIDMGDALATPRP